MSNDDRLCAIEGRLNSVHDSVKEIRVALLGDMKLEGEEGLIDKMRDIEKTRRAGTRIAWLAFGAGFTSWIKHFFEKTA